MAWPTATCVFGVLQMLGASQLGPVVVSHRYGQERPCFVFHPATRLTRQSWYTSLRVIQPCLLAEKIHTFCGEKVRKEKKGEGIKN